MPGYTDISPNEPDVTPDYIDDTRQSAPTAVMEPPSRPASAVKPEAAPSSSHRDGECIPNVPDVEPETVPLERVASSVRPDPLASASVDVPPPSSPWLRWYLGATVLVVGAFCFFLTSQAISSLAYAATLAPWLRYPLLGILGLSCLAVLVVCVALVRSWMRLRRVRQVDLDALQELRRRAKSREDGLEHMQAARASLEEYLLTYPLSAAKQPVLLSAGLKPETLEKLARSRDYLVGRSVDSMTWLDDFGRGFQDELDAAARARIKVWSLRAAGCVIASPLPFLDAVLVLSIALKMLRDVCVIYNIRASRSGLLLLLNKAIAAAFIAGVAENATEIAGGYAAEELSEMVGEGVLDSLGARVAGVVAPKLGEGAVNAFFIHRLGRSAVRMVQPLKPKKG
ncbi:MAG: DUF697 domain-containing protein [Planctomycetaceae bacterium]|nr:DUF697 domain-containing protein [Planctomycetaceae bacterium]